MAEWLAIDILECPLSQLAIAECAPEMLRMKFSTDGRDAATRDGTPTGDAQGASFFVVVSLTERLATSVEELAALEGDPATLQQTPHPTYTLGLSQKNTGQCLQNDKTKHFLG